jgi:hypothetical protein
MKEHDASRFFSAIQNMVFNILMVRYLLSRCRLFYCGPKESGCLAFMVAKRSVQNIQIFPNCAISWRFDFIIIIGVLNRESAIPYLRSYGSGPQTQF